jgi:integrase
MRIEKQADVGKAPPGRHGTAQRGLILIVAQDGRGRWAFRYIKRKTGKPTETGIGSTELITLAVAKDKAHELRKIVVSGGDPVEQKREERRKKITFGDMAGTYLGLMQPVWRSAKHFDNMSRLLTNHASSLASKAVDSITPDDIEACLRPTWTKSPDMGRRTLAALSQVFDLCLSYGHCERNPADWRLLKRRFPSRHQTKPHSAMDYRAIPGFVQRLHVEQERDEVLSPFVLEFLLLTACRVNEVCGMKWDEAPLLWTLPPDLTWNIPAARMMKSDREHRVPLSTRAVELLARQRERTKGEYVWPGVRGKKPISTKSVYLYLVRTMSLKFTLHGFRSSFRDWAGNETNFDRVTCELALAHRAGDATKLAYRRSDALEKRRALMQAWADFCAGRLIMSS